MTDEGYARYSPWQQPAPTVHYALRLSDEDVKRIAIAVVARLELLRGAAARRGEPSE